MRSGKMLVIMVVGLVVSLAVVGKAAPMGTAWTYQGRLMDANDPGDGLYDFQFKLYDANVAGTQQGGTVVVEDLDIIEGNFTVELDFGSSVFNGDARWLEIIVRQGDSSDVGDYVTLSPRQEISPTPYALQTRGIFVDSAENVGIGTTTPTQKVTVQDARPRIGLVEDGGDAAVLEFHEQENQLRLQHWTDYGSTWNRDMMVLDGDTGHVGIGTTNPHQKLHIMEGGIGFTDSVNPIDERLLYFGITGIGPDRRGYKFSWRNDDRSLRSDAMILDRTGDVYFMGGNVGIGTPDPLYDLHINDYDHAYVKTESASGSAFFIADGSNNSGLKIQEDGTTKAYVYWNTANDFLSLNDGGEDRLVVKEGNVGIGTTSPQAKLHVNGGLQIGSEPNSVKIHGMFLLNGESYSSAFIYIPFPAGYTSSNSMVISAEVQGTAGWRSVGYHPSTMSGELYYTLSNAIRIYLPDIGFNAIKPYRVLLMKIE